MLTNIYDLINLDSNKTNLEFDDGYYLINIWATWCVPCLKKINKLIKNKDKISKNITIINISVDRNFNRWKLYAEKNYIIFENYLSKDSKILKEFGVIDLPFSIIIKNNTVNKINPDINYILSL